MRLIRLTARRLGSRLITESVDAAGEVPDAPRYWDPLADVILACMARDGIIEGGAHDVQEGVPRRRAV